MRLFVQVMSLLLSSQISFVANAAPDRCASAALPLNVALDADVFDVKFYTSTHFDLSSLNREQATKHWVQHGICEGRLGAALFHSKDYLQIYPDLAKGYGNTNYSGALAHYVQHGMSEGRRGRILLSPVVFNVKYYKSLYPDLSGMTDAEATMHWAKYGLKQGRTAATHFSASDYLFLRQDLKDLGITTYEAAVRHYVINDFKYRQVARLVLAPEIFEWKFYVKRHPQLNLTTKEAAEKHWITKGLAAGMKASAAFSAAEYLKQYSDLSASFGATNYNAAALHYMKHGRKEGRSGLLQLSKDFSQDLPSSGQVKAAQGDRVESFISPSGRRIEIVVKVPVAGLGKVQTMRAKKVDETADNYFATAIADAIAAKASKLIIPPGTYNFHGKDSGHWIIHGAQDLIIDGQGSALHFSKATAGISITGSQRLVLKNFTIDYPKLSIAALGTIVNRNGEHVLQIDSSYPVAPSSVVRAMTSFDLKTHSWSLNPEKEFYFLSKGLNNPVYEGNQIFTSQAFASASVGAVYLVRYYVYNSAAVLVQSSGDVTFRDITIYGGPGMGFILSRNGRGLRLTRCAVKRKSPERLISTAADAVHFGGNQGDIIIEDGEFAYQGDDGLNIHTGFHELTVNRADQVVMLARKKPLVGDQMAFFNSGLGYLGATTVTAVTSNGDFSTVTLKRAIANLSNDSVFVNMALGSNRYLVQNNSFHHNRARGIILESAQGLVRGNTFTSNTMRAILLESDNRIFFEGAGANDLIITNNEISHTGASSARAGAIEVLSISNSGSVGQGSIQNLEISNNTFNKLPGPAIYVNSARDMTIKDNNIMNANTVTSQSYLYRGTAQTKDAILIMRSYNVDISGSMFSGPTTGGISIDVHSTGKISNRP